MRWDRASFGSLLNKNRQKIRFLLVGGINTLFGLSAYPVIYYQTRSLGLGYLWVLAISQVICVTFSFFMNKNLVFKTQGNYLKEYKKFITFHGAIFTFNLILLPLLVERLGLPPVIAQTLFTILIIVCSYFWYSKVTFK